MAKFRVTLTADAYMAAVVDIEAASADEADAKAVQWAKEGNASWRYQGVDDTTIEPNGDTAEVS